MTSPQVDPANYKVGWVCPLPVELRAARLILDEVHIETLRRENDPSLYTLGRIGEHNVVISGLPSGRTGTHFAASVAARMNAAFPNIQFGLLVGVGGGVPGQNGDIRLGDVVVSQPSGGHGGVIQYDFGKSTSDGFERTGSLSPPPAILLHAMSSFQAAYPPGSESLRTHISMLGDNSDSDCRTANPDLLFQPEYEHVGLDPTCTSCNKDRLITRPARHDPRSYVHYGLIASANRVMKSGSERDRVSRDLGGVLCFEMEAAGLMNDFPCLVIRGICDYADSHKNKSWQSYAATVAAAYAKTFLSVIPTTEITANLCEDKSIVLREPRNIEEFSPIFRQLLQSNSTLSDVIAQLASPNALSDVRSQKPNSPTGVRKQLRHIHHTQAANHSMAEQCFAECMCEPLSRTRQWQRLAFVHFRNVFRSSHYSFCPKYKVAEQSLEYMMRIIPPKWLLAYTIDLSFRVRNWRTMKGFQISPLVIGTTRLVDAAKSPAFRAAQYVEEELQSFKCLKTGYGTIMKRLQLTLCDLFRNGAASALDEDHSGDTILSKVADLYDITWTDRELGTVGEPFIELVCFLLDCGSDPNVLYKIKDRGFLVPHDRGTLLDTFSCVMVSNAYLSIRGEALSRLFCRQLMASGCELTQPFENRSHPKFRYFTFESELSVFRHFPEQLELCGHNRLVSIILQKSEKDLIWALVQEDINAASALNGLTALHFAIEWPLGVKVLLEAGANVDAEDRYHRRPIHLAVALGYLESVKLLLQYDCSLMTPPRTPSLLFAALCQSKSLVIMSRLSCSDREDIIDAVIDALVDRYDRLLTLAYAYLSQEEILALQLQEDKKREQYLPLVMMVMKKRGCTIPKALELDDKSVYEVIDDTRCCMTPTIADKLWAAGFDQIDEFNEDGFTPLLQNWFVGNFKMVSWLMSKGVRPGSLHRDAALNGLHFYAAGLGWNVSDPEMKASREDIASVVTELSSSEELYRDDCTSKCPCAPDGCTPLSLMAKLGPLGLQSCFSTWLETIKPSPAIQERHLCDFTRALLFNGYYWRRHVCCSSFWSRLDMPSPIFGDPPSAEELTAWQERLDTDMEAFTRYKQQYNGPVDQLPFRFKDDYVSGSWRNIIEVAIDDQEAKQEQDDTDDEREVKMEESEAGNESNGIDGIGDGGEYKRRAGEETGCRAKRRKVC